MTGTSRGLGLAIALDLASDRRVLGVARGATRGCDSDPRCANFEHRSGVDLSDIAQVEELASELGECDALINNAAVAHDGILATQSIQSIATLLDANVLSAIILTKLYVRQRMVTGRGGIVLTIGSVVALRGFRGLAVYSASKAALGAFSRSMAREMGGKGFRFNTVLPGFLETDMSQGMSAEQRRQLIRRTPLGRLGTVADVTPVVRFLLSPGAAYITGQDIVVDGGSIA